MADCIDATARTMIQELRTDHEILATEVHGARGDNGINSKVNALIHKQEDTDKHVNELEEWGHNIWHVERPANCIGKKAVEDLEERLLNDAERREKEMLEMRRARMAMYSALGVAVITTIGPIIQKLIGE